MTFVLLAPIIYWIIKNKYRFAICFIALMVINICFKVDYFSFSYFLPLYILGGFLGLNYSDTSEKFIHNNMPRKITVPICLFLLLITMLCIYLIFATNIYIMMFLFRYVCMIPIIVIVKMTDVKKPPLLIVSGGMYLYCAHNIVYRIIRIFVIKQQFPSFEKIKE